MARYTGFTPETKRRVLARSGGSCEAMRAGCLIAATEYHHRVNRGMGTAAKSGGPEACLHLCRACHRWLGGHVQQAYHLGLLVRRNGVAQPADVPVRWRARRWVLLDDEGRLWPAEAPEEAA